ncbi:MAG: hypothetical protein ACPG6P_06365 [Akkermansiaceae bacterium]
MSAISAELAAAFGWLTDGLAPLSVAAESGGTGPLSQLDGNERKIFMSEAKKVSRGQKDALVAMAWQDVLLML